MDSDHPINTVLLQRLEHNVEDAQRRNVGVRIGRRSQSLIKAIKIRNGNLEPKSTKVKLVDLESSFQASAASIKQLPKDELHDIFNDLDALQ